MEQHLGIKNVVFPTFSLKKTKKNLLSNVAKLISFTLGTKVCKMFILVSDMPWKHTHSSVCLSILIC